MKQNLKTNFDKIIKNFYQHVPNTLFDYLKEIQIEKILGHRKYHTVSPTNILWLIAISHTLKYKDNYVIYRSP